PLQGATAGNDLLHEPIAQRPGGIHARARLQQVERVANTQHRAQPLRAAVDERDAPAPVEYAELRSLAGDPEVTPEGQLQPAGEAVALDGRDGRLAGIQARETERACPLPARALDQRG